MSTTGSLQRIKKWLQIYASAVLFMSIHSSKGYRTESLETVDTMDTNLHKSIQTCFIKGCSERQTKLFHCEKTMLNIDCWWWFSSPRVFFNKQYYSFGNNTPLYSKNLEIIWNISGKHERDFISAACNRIYIY